MKEPDYDLTAVAREKLVSMTQLRSNIKALHSEFRAARVDAIATLKDAGFTVHEIRDILGPAL